MTARPRARRCPSGLSSGAPAPPMSRRSRSSSTPTPGKILLEKNLVTLYEAVQEFWVAELDGELVGCGALHVLWSDLGEVRTVAVHPKVRGQGIGHAIVDRLARRRPRTAPASGCSC